MIKVTIGESKPQEKPFPKLMIGECKTIVLALSKNENSDKTYTVLRVGDCKLLCNFSLFNSVNPFADYNEPITIQNA